MGNAQYSINAPTKEPHSIAHDSVSATTARLHKQADKLIELVAKLDEICDSLQPEPQAPATGTNPPQTRPERPACLVGSLTYHEQRTDGLLSDLEYRLQRLENLLGA
jgi:hypothetical protein